MIYLGIDVGIINLACVKILVNEKDFSITRILNAFSLNLFEILHAKVKLSECKLHHSNNIYDKITHFLQEYKDEFSDVDCVCIERQPIGGLVHVEQLLFGHFRSMAKLISPNSMHKFLGIGQLIYDNRKKITSAVAEPYLKDFIDWKNKERVHDMGDAFCILLFALHKDQDEHNNKIKKEQCLNQQIAFHDKNITVDTFFNNFKFDEKT